MFFFVGGGWRGWGDVGDECGDLFVEISIGSCDFCLGAESGFQWNLGLYFVDARFSPVNGVITPLSID